MCYWTPSQHHPRFPVRLSLTARTKYSASVLTWWFLKGLFADTCVLRLLTGRFLTRIRGRLGPFSCFTLSPFPSRKKDTLEWPTCWVTDPWGLFGMYSTFLRVDRRLDFFESLGRKNRRLDFFESLGSHSAPLWYAVQNGHSCLILDSWYSFWNYNLVPASTWWKYGRTFGLCMSGWSLCHYDGVFHGAAARACHHVAEFRHRWISTSGFLENGFTDGWLHITTGYVRASCVHSAVWDSVRLWRVQKGELQHVFNESLEYLHWAILVNSNIELLISILFKCFRCSNESNQKAIRDRSSKVEIGLIHSNSTFEGF
jgi:hypothetical protein